MKKDIPIVISSLVLLIYLVIGDLEINYLGGLHLFVDHLMIFMFLRNYPKKRLKILGMAINSTLLCFTTFWYLFQIEIDIIFNLILFGILVIFLFLYSIWDY